MSASYTVGTVPSEVPTSPMTGSPSIPIPTRSNPIPTRSNCDHYYQTYLSYKAEYEGYMDLAQEFIWSQEVAQRMLDDIRNPSALEKEFFLEKIETYGEYAQSEYDRASHAKDQMNHYYNLYKDCLQ